jgi:hypothetical protein
MGEYHVNVPVAHNFSSLSFSWPMQIMLWTGLSKCLVDDQMKDRPLEPLREPRRNRVYSKDWEQHRWGTSCTGRTDNQLMFVLAIVSPRKIFNASVGSKLSVVERHALEKVKYA